MFAKICLNVVLVAALAVPAAFAGDVCVCSSATFTPSFVSDDRGLRLSVRDGAEGWTWDSKLLGGMAMPHRSSTGQCPISLFDLDGDGTPEIVITLSDGNDNGRIYAFKKNGRSFAPIKTEVAKGLPLRDYMVWDMQVTPVAPVTLNAQGHFLIRAKHFAVLGVASGVATYRFKYEGGIIRYVETIPEEIATR